MQTEIPKWMMASRTKTDLKTDRIPTNNPEEYLEITYYDVPFGVNVWGDVEGEIAHLERQIEKKKKDKTASLTANAVQVEQLYHKALLKKMVVKINGVLVSPAFFDAEVSQAGGLVLQKWIKFKIEGEEYPKPRWLLVKEEQENEPQTPIQPSSPGPDEQVSSGQTDGGDSTGF
jgi:hypothetical protein